MDENRCGNDASHRFTWPGQDESFICDEHLPKLLSVANAIGMHLQVIPLTVPDGEKCAQRVQR